MREKNKFMVLTYPNGDKYVGEVIDNKREGYGLYFYANGNYYYGKYKNNKQYGYGALFKQQNNNVTIQYWDGSDED